MKVAVSSTVISCRLLDAGELSKWEWQPKCLYIDDDVDVMRQQCASNYESVYVE